MNWVSYSEDIEELRQENEHYRRGIDAFIDRLKKGPSADEIRRVESENRSLAEKLIKRYEAIKADAEIRFEEAIKLLKDPAVRITDKVDKRTRERDDLRAELAARISELKKCRESQGRHLERIESLNKQTLFLQNEVTRLKDELFVCSQMEGVAPLRRK